MRGCRASPPLRASPPSSHRHRPWSFLKLQPRSGDTTGRIEHANPAKSFHGKISRSRWRVRACHLFRALPRAWSTLLKKRETSVEDAACVHRAPTTRWGGDRLDTTVRDKYHTCPLKRATPRESGCPRWHDELMFELCKATSPRTQSGALTFSFTVFAISRSKHPVFCPSHRASASKQRLARGTAAHHRGCIESFVSRTTAGVSARLVLPRGLIPEIGEHAASRHVRGGTGARVPRLAKSKM